jgi:hypothetical protein
VGQHFIHPIAEKLVFVGRSGHTNGYQATTSGVAPMFLVMNTLQ